MSSYDEHLISMAGGDGDTIDANNHAFLLALVKKQAARIERVRKLHTFAHTDVEPWAMGYRYSGDHCSFDGEHWPCETIAEMTALEPTP